MKRNLIERPLGKLLSIVLSMALVLTACGNTSGGSASSASATQGSATQGSASVATATGELAGKPWVTSILSGNLPSEAPAAKDDLYTHYAYDWLSEHQGTNTKNMVASAAEIPVAMANVIKDESKSGHDLDQLRILYNQASDAEALQKTGLSEVQPYLDRIDAVTSIDELNALITADDFPFSPFFVSIVATSDLRSDYIAKVMLNLLFADPYLQGGLFYQDAETAEQQASLDVGLLNIGQTVIFDLMSMGMSQEEAVADYQALTAFEKTYGKYADYPGQFNKAEYGAEAQSAKDGMFTLDQMCALCPNYPLKATLEKVGKAHASTYISGAGYLKAFNDVWTNENLESLKKIAKYKVLQETRPYRDPTKYEEIATSMGVPATSQETYAYKACISLDTLGQVVAKSYVGEVVGTKAKTRLETMTNSILSEYKDLLNKTTWVGDESKAALIEKVDHMTLNMLEPVGGYFDYSNLELTKTEDGGTLFSNYLKCKQYRYDKESKMIGTPARATYAWTSISPMVTNAFYDASNNSINIYPGYISSLVYNDDMSDADMLAAIGFTVGHEISHAFDFSASQFNAYGEPNPVFSGQDVDAYVKKTNALADYYSSIEVMPGTNVDGQHVVGEAAADLNGMQVTLALGQKTEGFDYERFCSRFAVAWGNVVNEASFTATLADTHPLDNLRMNVCSQMFDPMYEKLGVKEGDGMYLAPDKRVVFWGPNA